MTTNAAHILPTSYSSERTSRHAPAGRLIRASAAAARPELPHDDVMLHSQVHGTRRRSVKVPVVGFCFLSLGIGGLLGSGVLHEAGVQSPPPLLVIQSAGAGEEARSDISVRQLRMLAVRESPRSKVTSDELPFKSLNTVSHSLEVPTVNPMKVRYRERLASFSTAQPLSATYGINPSGLIAPAEIVPTRYVNSATATPPSGSHMTSRVLSIIKKHAPKNRNSKILADAIVREALAQNYDPLFVAAVIKTESLFNPVARSHKGAQGLMQIMPATGAWLANRESLPRLKLTDTRHNLRLGITYLKQLESEYNGDRVFTLVAYNWGPGHVQMASGGKRRIPGECLRYAVRILNDYRRWKSGVI